MTYFGFALILGGGTVLLAMWREFGPRWAPAGARAAGRTRRAGAAHWRYRLPGQRGIRAATRSRAATAPAARSRAATRVMPLARTGDPSRRAADPAARQRTDAARRAREVRAEEPQRARCVHPRAEARRVLHAQRQAAARAEAARLERERVEAEALAAARAARTWAGYGYSYGGAAPADPTRRRPSPRPTRPPADRVATGGEVAPPTPVPPPPIPLATPVPPGPYRGTVYVSAAARAGEP